MKIIVYGIPGPQGSKKFLGFRGGKGIMVESSPKVKPWREAVKHAAREALVDMPCILGPLRVRMTFTLPKPKSAPKSRRTYPDKKPDLSKLIRSTEDALTDIGAWEDDARVVDLVAGKRYPNEGLDALDRPGVVISVEQCLEDLRRWV